VLRGQVTAISVAGRGSCDPRFALHGLQGEVKASAHAGGPDLPTWIRPDLPTWITASQNRFEQCV
jgi:hypothetical protein